MPSGDPGGYLPRVKRARRRLGQPVYQPKKSVRAIAKAKFDAAPDADANADRNSLLKARLKRKRAAFKV